MGLVAGRRIQIGKEAANAPGTEVAADTTLIGTLSVTPNIRYHSPMDERNSLAENNRDVQTSHSTTLQYNGDATYDQILHFLGMTLRGGRTASTISSATAARDWNFNPLLSTPNTQDTYTFEYGDDSNQWTIPNVFGQSMELGITMGEILSLSASMMGHFAIDKAQTANVTEVFPNEIISESCQLFIDPTWAAVGTTEYDSELSGGSIRFASGLTPLRTAKGLSTSGRANFSRYSTNRRSHSLDLDVLMTAAGKAQVYDSWKNNTFKAIRLLFSREADSIESGFQHELEVDMYGKFTSDPNIYGAD